MNEAIGKVCLTGIAGGSLHAGEGAQWDRDGGIWHLQWRCIKRLALRRSCSQCAPYCNKRKRLTCAQDSRK
jgi:hypothetical protein